MGLDITVHVSRDRVTTEITNDTEFAKYAEAWSWATEFLPENPRRDDEINTRPGSYSGLHRVRRMYARRNGVPMVNGEIDYESDQAKASHLLNHCDAGGCYLANGPTQPGWVGTFSVGWSYRLLTELMTMFPKRDEMDPNERHAYAAILSAAIASVVTGAAIIFH